VCIAAEGWTWKFHSLSLLFSVTRSPPHHFSIVKKCVQHYSPSLSSSKSYSPTVTNEGTRRVTNEIASIPSACDSLSHLSQTF
jgi:hypothetical protein